MTALRSEDEGAAAMSRAWTLIFRVIALAGALPLALTKHLPFADLPEHVAVIATLRHWWTPSWRSQENFVVEGLLRTQYFLYDLVGAALAFPLGTAERANFVIVVATAIGFPYALAALLRSLGRDPRLGLFGVLLFWNRALAEGLLPFVTSIPVTLFTLSLVVKRARAAAPLAKDGLRLALLTLAIFYLHLSSYLLFVLAAGVVVVGLRRPDAPVFWSLSGVRQLARGSSWLAPSLLVALLFAASSSVTHPDLREGAHAETVRFLPKMHLLGQLPLWMHDFWTTTFDDVFALVAWVGIGTAIVAARSSVRGEVERADGRVAASLVLTVGLLYFTLPTQVGFAFILDLRMAPFVGAFFVLLAAPPPGRWRELSVATVAVAALGLAATSAVEMVRLERDEGRHIDTVLRNLPEGKRLLSLIFDPRSRYTKIAPHLHIGSYYRARYGGLASFSFSELPHWPVRYRKGAAPPAKPIVFWDFDPCQYRNTSDGPYYDFVLVRGRERPFFEGLPGPRFRLIGGARDLRLYERLRDAPFVPGTDLTGPCVHADGASEPALPSVYP
ncbi:MAG: hypothetical protein IPG50_36730 [Myxococcales bacterium]|nr:hypothetical protein [Myxococcales bacterium]